jgi:hypothetical protein
MHFCAIHLDDAPWPPAEEQVYVVVPGGSRKTAVVVSLDALPRVLPLLEDAVGGTSRPTCSKCAAKIPKLRMSPEAHREPADPG